MFERIVVRGAIPALLPMVLCAATLASGCGKAAPDRPDVVLVVVDSLRADHLDHLGYERATAAPLDAFRARATLFSNAWATSPMAVPSMASLFTGRYGVGHGARGGRPAIRAATPSLAETLAEHGWSTAALPHHVSIAKKLGFARGFARFDVSGGTAADSPDAAGMLPWVREWLANAPEGPFFLYLHPMNVHSPYRVPRLHRATLLGRPPKDDFTVESPAVRMIMREHRIDVRPNVRASRVASLVEQYDAAIRYTTGRIAEVFALLESVGRFDGALVIVTSDHGEELFDHGGFGHGYTLFREVLHVPLYVKLPGQRTPLSVDTPVSLVDVLPTVLDALGIPPLETHGVSLLPAARGEPFDPGPRPLYHELLSVQTGVARGVIAGRYKLIDVTASYDGLVERRLLYDLTVDPREQTDLSEQGREIADRLASEMDRDLGRLGAGRGP